uniref:Uncharacterized protein n=1 Tax=Lactococcus lactis subsp. lactis TaxID=1360 RepID=Q9RAV1_LACLL|nr:unknown [Lactococcus lactis subsp. lactis]
MLIKVLEKKSYLRMLQLTLIEIVYISLWHPMVQGKQPFLR